MSFLVGLGDGVWTILLLIRGKKCKKSFYVKVELILEFFNLKVNFKFIEIMLVLGNVFF